MAAKHPGDDYGDYGSVPDSVGVSGSGATPLGVRANPDDFGAQIGQGLEKFGATGEDIAQHYAEMAVHTQVNDQYVNNYAPQVNALVSDYKKLQGMDAVSQQPVYQQKIQDLNKQFLEQGSPMQRELMGGLVSRHTISTLDSISNHADQQFTQHENIVTQQSIKNASDDAANNWQNPESVDFNVNRAIGLSKLDATRKVGYDPVSQKVADQLSKEQGSTVVKSAIDMALDNNDYQTANFYKNKYSDVLSGKDKLSVEKKVSDLSISTNAASITDNLFGGRQAIPQGTPQYNATQTKAQIAGLAQKEGLDPNIAFALHGAESDYGRGITSSSRLKDDFQTDPKYRDKGYEDDSLASSVHNGAKIWNANSADLTKRLGRDLTPSEGYLAYNQGGAGANAILNAAPTDTAIKALSRIMPADEAGAHVMQNGGTPTMSASDFSNHIQELFQNHYNTQKVTVSGDTATAIRDHGKTQLPAIQQASNPHDYFKQVNDALPNAQSYADTIPDDKMREAVQKQIKLKYEQAKLGDTAWKNQQAQVANQLGQDQRYTSLDQVPQTVKSSLQDAGQLGALERQLNDKRNPKKDNTYGGSFLQTLGRMASDDKTDSIGDLAGLQETYADTPDLHSSGFKTLQGMLKTASTSEGKAVIGGQFQYLSSLNRMMVAGESDAEGKKAFEVALPKFFAAYSEAATKGNVNDILSLDPKNPNSFAATLKLPSSSEMVSKKIQSTSKWLTSTSDWGDPFGGRETPAPTFTAAEKVMADYHEGRLTAAQKDQKLRGLGVGPSLRPPRPD